MNLKTLLSMQELEEMGIGGRSKIYSLLKNTDFPKPLKYGRFNRWAKEDVQAWLDKQNPNHTKGGEDGRLTA